MTRSQLRLVTGLVIFMCLLVAGTVLGQEAGAKPTITQLGFQRENNQIEWIITVGNVGDEDAQNVVITDTIPDSLHVDTVQINTGTANINNQTVTVVLPLVSPNAVLQFSIFTTKLAEDTFVNTACISAENVVGTTCIPAMAVQSLPDTGESPYWRHPMLHLSLLTVSVSMVMFGMGLFGWQMITVEIEED